MLCAGVLGIQTAFLPPVVICQFVRALEHYVVKTSLLLLGDALHIARLAGCFDCLFEITARSATSEIFLSRSYPNLAKFRSDPEYVGEAGFGKNVLLGVGGGKVFDVFLAQ